MSDLSGRLAALTPDQRAQLSSRLAAAQPRPGQSPIAIIGVGCRFPGANSPEAFWNRLCEGFDAIRTTPPDRWDADQYFSADTSAAGKTNSRWGSFLDGIDQFDREFFGLSAREAAHMDPQQRLLLEITWEALEDSGQMTDRLAGCAAGVFIGVQSHSSDYYMMQARNPEGIDTYTATGTAHCILANRLSFLLDLRGPSLTVDTACSSSLVAVHLACQSLRLAECDLAIAGGVNLMLTPDNHICLSKVEMMSPDGRCKTFDHRANGYVRGEGCGVVILKRLPDAVRDRDPVLAVILGSAVNQDGASNGLTAPSGLAQQAVIRRALQMAQVAPERIGYVETHGTGTALGDPIEVEALGHVLGASVGRQPCILGALKTNLGHLEAAAGIAGLIKAVLCLKHGAIPPNLHFEKINPHLSLTDMPFVLPQALHPWPRGDEPRIAGVSSFGFGGTNAHVVLSEPPVRDDRPTEQPSPDVSSLLLTISARSAPALRELVASYVTFLTTGEEAMLSPTDIAYTANFRRRHHDYRCSVVGATASDWVATLRQYLADESFPPVSESAPPDVSAYSGHRRRCVQLPRYPWQRQRYWLAGASENEPPADWFYQVAWEARDSLIRNNSQSERTPEKYLIFGDSQELADELKRQLERRGDVCDLLRPGQSCESIIRECHAVIYFAEENRDEPDDLPNRLQKPLRLVQALLANGISPSRGLWFVTRGCQSIASSDAPDVNQSLLWGLGRSSSLEAPSLGLRLVDLDPGDTLERAVAALLFEMDDPGPEDQIALRDQQRYVVRLKRASDLGPARPPLRVAGTHLITGGLGGIGAQLALHLAAAGAKHLVLVVKRPLGIDGSRVEIVRQLEAKGAKVTVIACDLADDSSLANLLDSLDLATNPLRGIWHAAGTYSSAPIAQLDPRAVETMINVKATAAWRLHEFSLANQLDYFVLFSSTTALWGAPGFAHYAAANSYLDALAHFRRSRHLPATVINWGAWEQMRALSLAERERTARAGFRPMPAAAALAALERVLTAGLCQAVVGDIDWSLFKPAMESKGHRPFLEQVGVECSTNAAPPLLDPQAERLIDRLLASPADERRELLARHLDQLLIGVLGAGTDRSGAVGAIDRGRGFFELGMDSLTSVQLRRRLERDLQRSLPNTVAFNYPTVDSLTDYLLSQLGGTIPEAAPEAEPFTGTSLQPLETTDFEETTEDELFDLLAARLARI